VHDHLNPAYDVGLAPFKQRKSQKILMKDLRQMLKSYRREKLNYNKQLLAED